MAACGLKGTGHSLLSSCRIQNCRTPSNLQGLQPSFLKQSKPRLKREKKVLAVMADVDTTDVDSAELESQTAVYDIIARTRERANPSMRVINRTPPGPLGGFFAKLKAAFRIFFPPAMVTLSAKDQGKQRLQMILVADRCGMSTAGLTQMKTSIVRAVSEFVDIETEELVDVSITHDDDMGTIYSVSVPVKRVKAQALAALGQGEEVSLEWDTEAGLPSYDSDPASRFPYGC